MGGAGSGRRWYTGAAACTDDYRQIDVRRWQREGCLVPGKAYRWKWMQGADVVASINVRTEVGQVIFAYQHRGLGEGWKGEEYPVRLDWTACTYGGRRAWFLCPANGCGRRVAILYCGQIFACRRCYRLVYRSQRESDVDRAMRRAEKVRGRLGWGWGILNAVGDKPKGMRWHTFERLSVEHDIYANQSLFAMARRLRI